MGFRSNAYATVWSVEPGKGKFSKVRISISRKTQHGNYEQDFSGFCTFIGVAHAKADRLRERDRIRLGDVDVSTTYDKERGKEYVNYKVFDFEFADSTSTSSAVSNNTHEGSVSGVSEGDFGDVNEEELPF